MPAQRTSPGAATWMMRPSPLRGWHDGFLLSDPRVETRGYTPVSLRDNPLSPGGAQACSRGFQPAES